MLLKFVKPILIFIPLTAFQLVVVPLISVMDILPNIILVLLVYYTLVYGQIFGTLLGFVFGFLFDLVSGSILGAFMFSFTIAGFIAGYFHNENKTDINTTSYVLTVIVFLCSSVSLFIYSSVANNNPNVGIIYQIAEDGILPGFYTALCSIPVVILNPKKGLL